MWRFLSRPAARAPHRTAHALVGDVAVFGFPQVRRCRSRRRATNFGRLFRTSSARSPTAHVGDVDHM